MTIFSGLERVRVDAVIIRCHNHDQEGQKFEVCSVRCSNDTVFLAYIMFVTESSCWRLKMLAANSWQQSDYVDDQRPSPTLTWRH